MRQLFLIAIAVFASSASTYLITRSAVAEENITAIVADDANGLVRIMVGGEEIARFTRNGLEVRDDVLFGGVITDVGIASYGTNRPAGGQ